jgi:hypothetical protein
LLGFFKTNLWRRKLSAVSWTRCLALLSLFATAPAAAENNPLADHVRAANDRFRDVSVAVAEGYAPIPCASGVDGGAMGVHYVKASLIGESVDIKQPQAVMYEPKADGKMELIAVEYITTRGRPSWKASSSISPARPIATACHRSTSCMSGPGRRTGMARLPT